MNVATKTNTNTIGVTFGTTLPNDNGSPIIGLQLQIDDGMGGNFNTIIG